MQEHEKPFPSARLLELCRTYLEIVDSGDESRQGEERAIAHEAMMDEMERERIPFNSRFEARWLARWMVAESKPIEYEPRLMFARVNPHNGRVKEMFFTPSDDNREGLVPVMAILMPFTYQPFVTERNT